MLERFHKKFGDHSNQLPVATREMLRYLYLSSYSPKPLFFPGNQLIDELWHSLVVETKEYANLCAKLGSGSFLHHSGVPFEQYSSRFTVEQIHEEQCSWLASYVYNFGPIEPSAFECLNLARSMAERMGGDLNTVNALGAELIRLIEKENEASPFVFSDFLELVRIEAKKIDSQVPAMAAAIQQLAKEIGRKNSELVPFTNDHLEKLFGASTALAFTFWQHLAATERLSGLPEWQERNPGLWEELRSAKLLCGLATTHLANPNGAGILGQPIEGGYSLSGKAAWVCGNGIFDKLLIGFESGDSIVFAITDFPSPLDPGVKDHAQLIRQEMVCLMGSGTVELLLENFFVPESAIVSQRQKSTAPPSPRTSIYMVPEIGIAKNAIQQVKNLANDSGHPKHKMIISHLPSITSRLKQFEELKSSGSGLDRLVPLRDQINHDAIRMLALALGASALLNDSPLPRLQAELLLLDSVLHSPASLEAKISETSRGAHV